MTDADNVDRDKADYVETLGPPTPGRGVYAISVAAELSGVSEQSLRLYERHGLLTPARSAGGTRRYSADDLARLERISELVDAGVNLAGIARILSLEDRNTALDNRNVTLEGDIAGLRAENDGHKKTVRRRGSQPPTDKRSTRK